MFASNTTDGLSNLNFCQHLSFKWVSCSEDTIAITIHYTLLILIIISIMRPTWLIEDFDFV